MPREAADKETIDFIMLRETDDKETNDFSVLRLVCLAACLPGCLAVWLSAWLPGCLAAWLQCDSFKDREVDH